MLVSFYSCQCTLSLLSDIFLLHTGCSPAYGPARMHAVARSVHMAEPRWDSIPPVCGGQHIENPRWNRKHEGQLKNGFCTLSQTYGKMWIRVCSPANGICCSCGTPTISCEIDLPSGPLWKLVPCCAMHACDARYWPSAIRNPSSPASSTFLSLQLGDLIGA